MIPQVARRANLPKDAVQRARASSRPSPRRLHGFAAAPMHEDFRGPGVKRPGRGLLGGRFSLTPSAAFALRIRLAYPGLEAQYNAMKPTDAIRLSRIGSAVQRHGTHDFIIHTSYLLDVNLLGFRAERHASVSCAWGSWFTMTPENLPN
jgi:hypothetical protein